MNIQIENNGIKETQHSKVMKYLKDTIIHVVGLEKFHKIDTEDNTVFLPCSGLLIVTPKDKSNSSIRSSHAPKHHNDTVNFNREIKFIGPARKKTFFTKIKKTICRYL